MPQVGASPPLIIHPQSSSSSAAAGLNSDSNKDSAQKRKRVTRACDECRKKKVKCDGQQPCIHCTVYSYDCTYDRPSNRKKTIADINLIEQKLKNAESILQLIIPDLDINDTSFNIDVFEKVYDDFQQKKDNNVNFDGLIDQYKKEAIDASPPVEKSKEESPPSPTSSRLPNADDIHVNKKPKLKYPHQTIDGSIESKDGREIKIILPPKNVALELVAKTWSFPCVLFRFYHRPSFVKDLDELYETDPENYTNKQNKFLPLAYSVMAVGALFSKKNGIDDKFLEDEGFRYFVAARKLIDITDARDLHAIQTIVMLVLFLQCSARLSTCYSYIGVALRSALREGLHRKVEQHPFNPIEIETRKRLFWTIYKMDIYINTMLGLPRSISPEDIDQDLPLELDDENITETGYLPQHPGKLSSSGVANNHTHLIQVLHNIVKNLYPINTDLKVISHEKVSEMELELREWLSNLPRELIPGFDPPYQYFKANRLLHLSFLHVQIVLYRPFIHYVSPKYTSQPNVDPLSIQRAKNCISVARTVVKLAQDMIDKNLLSGSYWFSIYTIFFSVACLVYYVHEVPFDEFHPDYIGIRHDAETGREILTFLKDSSMAASRIYSVLNQLFEQLNRKTASLHKKRQDELEKEETKRKKRRVQQENTAKTATNNNNSNNNYLTFDVPIPQNLVNNNINTTQINQPAENFNANNSNNNVRKYNPTDIQQISSTYPNIKLEEAYNDFDHLANFDSFINQPSTSQAVNQSQSLPQSNQQPSSQLGQQNTINLDDARYQHLGINNPSSTSPSLQPQQVPPQSSDSFKPEDNYMPGIMDQLDMQIFGRFLPPYMMKQRDESNFGPGSNGGDLPSGLNTTNNPKSLKDLSLSKNSSHSTPASATGFDDNLTKKGNNNNDNSNNNNNNNNNNTLDSGDVNVAEGGLANTNTGFPNLDNWPEFDQNDFSKYM